MTLYQFQELQSKSYRELQAIAKTHGVKANSSKATLIDILTSTDQNPPSVDSSRDSNTNLIQDNVDMIPSDSDTPVASEQPRGESGKPRGDEGSNVVPIVDSTNLGACNVHSPANPIGDDTTSPDSSKRPKSAQLSDTKRGTRIESVPAAVDTPLQGSAERAADVPCSKDPEVLPDRSKSELPAGTGQEPRTHRKTPGKIKTKPGAARLARRFERMHQNLFAGQASIETYGKTPKKTAPAKENVPLSKVTPVRPVESGSDVTSAKRRLTVASKPCTMVVQRSTKKLTQIKEFRLSSNEAGKREGFKFRPYTGPVRPFTPAKEPHGFNMGSTSAPAQNAQKKNPRRKGLKDTLASARAQAARKSAHVQSSKTQRKKKAMEARMGHAEAHRHVR